MSEPLTSRTAQIISVARGVFLREGYAATSMSRIAAAAGGSKATLYHYFPSKQDLFFAVVRAESARSLAHLFEGDNAGPDFAEDLRALCIRFLGLVLSDDLIALFRLITAEADRFPEIGQFAYEASFARGLERMAARIKTVMARGGLRADDPQIAAERLLGLAMGSLHIRRLWQVADAVSVRQISDAADHVVSAFLAMYGVNRPECL